MGERRWSLKVHEIGTRIERFLNLGVVVNVVSNIVTEFG